MRKLVKPQTDFLGLYDKCVSSIKDSQKQDFLKSLSEQIVSSSESYDSKAEASELYSLTPEPLNGKEDLKRLYKEKLVRQKSPGRDVYDQLFLLANNKCPFCSQGVAYTLDHFLPKGRFPEFSIYPNNLVPCCRDCNSAKGEYYSNLKQEQLIHPYYDDVGCDVWLKAEVKPRDGAISIDFSIARIPQSEIHSRIEKQFNMLRLAFLYSARAAEELSDQKYRFDQLYEVSPDELKQYLEDQFKSCEQSDKNSWKTAMYRALKGDEHFLSMDWKI